MAMTFGFVGNRPDVGNLIAASQKEALVFESQDGRPIAWGAGFFQADEVLLRRRPADLRSRVSLADELGEVRAHALLAQARPVSPGELTTESTPPLRFGHLLFTCHGTPLDPGVLRTSVLPNLEPFLRPTVGDGTFVELAFSLFLAALPRTHLERSRDVSAARGVVEPPQVRDAIRQTFARLDEFSAEGGGERFTGGIWVCSGEHLVIGHRSGPLGLRVFRSRRELERLADRGPTGPDQSLFVTALEGVERLPQGWERLPDLTILTAGRNGTAETESLEEPLRT